MENREEEVENARRLDKLPKEVWEKILSELENEDLFPLALSCRYFRQKQKELVARPRQSGSGREVSRLALKTILFLKLEDDQPASIEYLRFCSKENVPFDEEQESQVRCLAALHGYLPLLQELLKHSKKLDFLITGSAGQYFFPRCLLFRFGF